MKKVQYQVGKSLKYWCFVLPTNRFEHYKNRFTLLMLFIKGI